MSRSAITTHVLDTAAGRPAAGVPVTLELRTDAGWQPLGSGSTDTDGRIGELGPQRTVAGVHRLTFDVSGHFPDGFFPEVAITFAVTDPDQHYHVPLLLSPFAFSTYRGS